MLENALYIFFGCGLGGLLRYGVSELSHRFLGQGFPYGTLLVNVTGSFLMGFLFVVMTTKANGSTLIKFFFLVGLLGGYTTFSSFSLETLAMIESGSYWGATLNAILSVVLCITGVWVGVSVGKELFC